jgi:hypothetical protein
MTKRCFVPHFSVTTIDGELCPYAELWQKKNLLLVVLPRARSSDIDSYVSVLRSHSGELQATDTTCVITSDRVPGVAFPGVVIADRWGEITFSAEARSASELPPYDTLIDWLRHIQSRCPECEGEAR